MAQAAGKQTRIIGIDICRSFAILLAMLSHAFVETQALTFLPKDVSIPLRFLLQMAPPIFIILFGAMLEIVYKSRFEGGQIRQATQRLLTRALQCYLLYGVSILAMLAAGQITAGYAARCMLLMGVTPYADILKFYALALAFAPAFLMIRMRWGLAPLVVVSILVHAAYPLFAAVPAPPQIAGQDYLSPVIGFLSGMTTQEVGGPSVLHGMTFVVWGLVIGQAVGQVMSGQTREIVRRGRLVLASMFCLAVIVTLVRWHWYAPFETMTEIANLTLRNANLPIYFALGCCFTIASLALCLFLYDRKGVRFGHSVTFAGRTSLFTFSMGNVILYLAPDLNLGPLHAWLYTGLLFGLICLQSYVFWKVQSPPAHRQASLAGRSLQTLIVSTSHAVSQIVSGPAAFYSALLGSKSPAFQAKLR